MNPEHIIAGLDIGSAKTTAVIGQAAIGTDGKGTRVLRILGVGQARTTGLRRGIVSDIEETTRSIKKAIEDAERMSGTKIDTIFAGIAGGTGSEGARSNRRPRPMPARNAPATGRRRPPPQQDSRRRWHPFVPMVAARRIRRGR